MEEILGKTLKKIKDATARAAERAEKMQAFDHVAGRETLMEIVNKKLKGRKLILVSNREPYAHVFDGQEVTWFRSAGGLTIALDSMAAACGAVWVCHGEAEADFTVTDERGMVGVPPNQPSYLLKRIRLTPEEENGYYEGFSNETLWPLCHVCYVRPKFALSNWETYQAVNRKFAAAVCEEAAPGSIVFLQDYHLCMAAKYLKQERPDLTTVLFWHIPWPNPEIFRILPWKKEILEGLLANDIIGFHLKYHADNFMETVGLELEGRLDKERMIISRNDTLTRIRFYPISVDFNSIFHQAYSPSTAEACSRIRTELNLAGRKIGLGVDRIDYTKGIPERLDAIERLFEKYPEHIGKFTFIQIGVPSRTHLEDYQQVVSKIETRCDEINAKCGRGDWRPMVFKKGHQNFDTLIPYYQLADICVVSSLHDGMNLVSKEFVAASNNDRGVLVLSRFTGAARELEQALLINPYDTENVTDTLHQALTMPAEEQKNRLERMRITVAENNIFSWTQSVLNDIVKLAEDSQVNLNSAK